jgi:plastocyanin domain-containing protein
MASLFPVMRVAPAAASTLTWGLFMRHAAYVFILSVLLIVAVVPGSSAADEKPFTATVGADGVQTVEVTAGGYFYKPSHIIVRVGVPVKLNVTREGGLTPHDIVMQSPEAGMEFSEGLSTTAKAISFTPTKPGKYPFFCSKKPPFGRSHRERGMEGVLEVVP